MKLEDVAGHFARSAVRLSSWKIGVETDVAARRLERLEKEKDEQGDEEHEASPTQALADKPNVVMLVVDQSRTARSSSSPPASCKAPKSSRSAQTRWCRS